MSLSSLWRRWSCHSEPKAAVDIPAWLAHSEFDIVIGVKTLDRVDSILDHGYFAESAMYNGGNGIGNPSGALQNATAKRVLDKQLGCGETNIYASVDILRSGRPALSHYGDFVLTLRPAAYAHATATPYDSQRYSIDKPPPNFQLNSVDDRYRVFKELFDDVYQEVHGMLTVLAEGGSLLNTAMVGLRGEYKEDPTWFSVLYKQGVSPSSYVSRRVPHPEVQICARSIPPNMISRISMPKSTHVSPGMLAKMDSYGIELNLYDDDTVPLDGIVKGLGSQHAA